MTPLNATTIQDKLFRLKENSRFIEDILTQPDDAILLDVARYYGLEHLLQLSIEVILDIASHILAEEFDLNPPTYRDVIGALGEKGIIANGFATEQQEMAKFRNVLIHDYDKVDKKKVLQYARRAPAIFRQFGKSFVDFVKSK